jgi:AbrB family looped-hinge helix DNA binding protein
MKTTVTMTSRGVITLPAKIRQALGLKADDQLIAETTPEGLLLRPAVTLPVELYTPEREREFDEAEAELADRFRAQPVRRSTPRKRTPARSER